MLFNLELADDAASDTSSFVRRATNANVDEQLCKKKELKRSSVIIQCQWKVIKFLL